MPVNKRNRTVMETATPYAGMQTESPTEAIRAIKKGLPLKAFDRLRDRLEINEARLAGVVGIKLRTLARRKIEGRFTPEESDRIHRLDALWERTVAFFKSEERAAAWLKAPQYHFRDVSPLDFADTEVGTREVYQLLGRIENGVF